MKLNLQVPGFSLQVSGIPGKADVDMHFDEMKIEAEGDVAEVGRQVGEFIGRLETAWLDVLNKSGVGK
jgi:hypothetical protein